MYLLVYIVITYNSVIINRFNILSVRGEVMKMYEKAIYGMAQPLADFYHEQNDETFVVQKTNRASVKFEPKVGITLGHDYSQVFGTTDENLFLQVSDRGVFFKIIPNCPLGWSIYKKVKRRALRHCSISFKAIQKQRNTDDEDYFGEVFRTAGVDDNILVEDYKKIVVFEVCLTNGPANTLTFCTTDAKDPRLEGLEWDNAGEYIPGKLIEPAQNRPSTFDKKSWISSETAALAQEISSLRLDYRKILGGR